MNAFIETLRSLGPLRLAAMAAVAAGIIAFFIYLTGRLASPDMALLYGELDSRDSSQIVTRLEAMGVPYSLGPSGTHVLVPRDQVGRLRVAMAEEGLPTGGSMGYEIFDRSEGLGTTNFVQNINHLRALEGELGRTIRSISIVKQARVHLVLPRRELFSREKQQPSASIVVSMQGSRRLDRNQVSAIQHMVAAAVPGLQPDMISIIDNKGTLLARGAAGDDAAATASNAEEMRTGYESRLTRTIEELLERSVGVGNVRAEVTADMDFDRITENQEIYDPDGQVVRSTQTIEETSASQDGEGAPPVTVGNNLPDAGLPDLGGGSNSQDNEARTEETVNYEISRTVKTHVREAGLVRRLSIGVLVNDRASINEDGDTVYEARGPEELEQFAALIRSATGYDAERGDTLEVVNMRFVDTSAQIENQLDYGLLGLTQAELMRIAELVVLGIVAILVLVLVVRPITVRILEHSATASEGASDAFDLLPDPTGAKPALLGPDIGGSDMNAILRQGGVAPGMAVSDLGEDGEGSIDLDQVEDRVQQSSLRKIGELVEKHPEETAAIIRNWLYTES